MKEAAENDLKAETGVEEEPVDPEKKKTDEEE